MRKIRVICSNCGKKNKLGSNLRYKHGYICKYCGADLLDDLKENLGITKEVKLLLKS